MVDLARFLELLLFVEPHHCGHLLLVHRKLDGVVHLLHLLLHLPPPLPLLLVLLDHVHPRRLHLRHCQVAVFVYLVVNFVGLSQKIVVYCPRVVL